jgi:hypothetical protein
MAVIVDEDLPIRRSYPWDELFNGKAWKLVEGEDFDDIRSFRTKCYEAARKRGVKVRTKMSSDWESLTIQAEVSDPKWRD